MKNPRYVATDKRDLRFGIWSNSQVEAEGKTIDLILLSFAQVSRGDNTFPTYQNYLLKEIS